MKALICGACMDIRALEPHGEWTACRCGNVKARWVDPVRGTVKVRAEERGLARILGLNNAFLLKAIEGFSHAEVVRAGGGYPEAWRKLPGGRG